MDGPVLDAVVSKEQGLMCFEIEVPTASLVANTTAFTAYVHWCQCSKSLEKVGEHQSERNRRRVVGTTLVGIEQSLF